MSFHFDEETFNYPPVEEMPHCLKLICPFWRLPLAQRLVRLTFLSCPVCVSPTIPASVCAQTRWQAAAQMRAGVRTVFYLFKCYPRSRALSPSPWMKERAASPEKGSTRSISPHFVLCRVCVPSFTKATIGDGASAQLLKVGLFSPHLISWNNRKAISVL